MMENDKYYVERCLDGHPDDFRHLVRRYQPVLLAHLAGKLGNHWGRTSVPDVTRPETQLWFYYLAGSYIDLGCEALHLGQVGLIGMADPT